MKIKGVVKAPPAIGGTALPFGGRGDSAYEVAVKNGFEGSEEEWLASLKGEDGKPYDSYIHRQTSAEETWVIQHNLNRRPVVVVVDSAGTVVAGEIQYIDDNLLLIKFSAGFSGTAYLGG